MSEKIDQLLQDAVECYVQRDWMQAQKAFEKVLTLDLDNQEANAFLGSVLVNLENYPDALARFEKVKDIDPPREYFHGEWGIMLNDWGRTLAYLEQFGEAAQKFANAVKYDPSSASNYYYNWGYVLERQGENPNRYAEAAEQYEAAVKADETYVESWNGWGRMLIELQKYDEAIEKFRKTIALDPQYKYGYYNWALVLERQGEYARAAEQYEAAVKADETYTDAWNGWGRMLIELQKYDEAIEKFRKAVELDPAKKHIYHLILGGLEERQGENPSRYAEAAEQYEAAVKADEAYTDGWNNWGRMLIELQKYDEAIEKFKKAVELDPRYKIGYYNWALALERQGEYTRAAEQYEAAVKADETYVESWNGWGRMLIELQKYDEAIEKFKKAVELDPAKKHIYHYVLAGLVEQQGENPSRYAEAAEKYEAAVKADETYTDAWNGWGRVLIELQKYDEAIEKFRKTVELDPRYKHAYHNWGLALERQGEYARAAEQYEAAVKADETYTDAWNGWGRVLIELQKYDEAIEKFKKAIELDPKYKYAYYNWALVLERQGEYTRAAEQYEATVKADETYTDAWNDWGRMLMDLKRYDEAIEKFRKAVELDPKYKIGYYNWGLALEWQDVKPKRYKEAIELYEKSVQADPQYIIAHNALGLAYLNVGQYSQADLEFRQIIEQDPTSAFGYHNLAFILEKQGKYKQAQEMWEKALHVYDDIPVAKKIQSDWRFLGEISFYYFQNYARSIEYLEEGLKRFPDSLELLSTYLTLSLELKEQYAYEAPQALELIASAYWKAFDRYQKAVKLLEEKLEKDKAEDSYVSLGRLYVTMKNYSDAEDKLKDAIKLNNTIAEAHNLLGLIKTMRGDYSEAVQDFQNALMYNPDDFGTMSNLAEVYRKSERFDDAEKIYQRILSIAPSHMDSLIGLGETYAAMGDAAKEGSHAADAEMMYTQAIQYYSKAIKYEEDAKNNKHGRFTEASKRLKTQELNAVYYSQGYARVSLYDAQSRKSDLLLLQARNDFRKVTKYPADENYHKARRAIKKVMEKLNPISTQNLEQRTGPVFISLLAFALFVISLFTFIRGRPEVSSPGFALTGQAVEILQTANIPPEAAASLEGLVGKEFTTQEGLLAAIELAVGEETYAAYEEVLLAQPFEEPSELVWKPIETGYLALMAFGSLIFMVAGLYLQQISKLKFGSIEIEKSAVSQISSSGVLGIKK